MHTFAFAFGLVEQLLLGYYVVINLVAYVTVWRDKRLAQKDRWRIRERTLFGMGFLFGWIGLLRGMRRFRHKTRKASFLFVTVLIVIWNGFWHYVYFFGLPF